MAQFVQPKVVASDDRCSVGRQLGPGKPTDQTLADAIGMTTDVFDSKKVASGRAGILAAGFPRSASLLVGSRAELKAGHFAAGQMVIHLLRSCVMILGTETGRLAGAAAPELNLAASCFPNVDRNGWPFQRSGTQALVRKNSAQNLSGSGLDVAPF